MSLFEEPAKTSAGLKVLVYGKEGTGKTVFALSFPDVALIDTEAGSTFYLGQEFGKNIRKILRTQGYKKYEDAMEEVGKYWEKLGMQTLVTDSVTKIRQNLSDTVINVDVKRNKRNGMADAELNSNLSMRSWGKIGEISKRHQNTKIDLSNNVNIVDVAQAKEIKDDNQNVINIVPDMDKSAPYDYDIKMFMFTKKDDKGKVRFYGRIDKDRTSTYETGEVIENPSFENWSDVLSGSGDRISTSYVSDQKEDEEAYKEEVEKDNQTIEERLANFSSELSDDDKKVFSELLKENKITNITKLTKAQQKKLIELMDSFKKS